MLPAQFTKPDITSTVAPVKKVEPVTTRQDDRFAESRFAESLEKSFKETQRQQTITENRQRENQRTEKQLQQRRAEEALAKDTRAKDAAKGDNDVAIGDQQQTENVVEEHIQTETPSGVAVQALEQSDTAAALAQPFVANNVSAVELTTDQRKGLIPNVELADQRTLQPISPDIDIGVDDNILGNDTLEQPVIQLVMPEVIDETIQQPTQELLSSTTLSRGDNTNQQVSLSQPDMMQPIAETSQSDVAAEPVLLPIIQDQQTTDVKQQVSQQVEAAIAVETTQQAANTVQSNATIQQLVKPINRENMVKGGNTAAEKIKPEQLVASVISEKPVPAGTEQQTIAPAIEPDTTVVDTIAGEQPIAGMAEIISPEDSIQDIRAENRAELQAVPLNASNQADIIATALPLQANSITVNNLAASPVNAASTLPAGGASGQDIPSLLPTDTQPATDLVAFDPVTLDDAGSEWLDMLQKADQQTSKANASQAQQAFKSGPSPAAEQIALQVRKALETGQEQFRLQLKPARLGSIDVQMTIAQDGAVQAVLNVENPETYDWLQKDRQQLERILQESGLNTNEESVQLQYRDSQQQHSNQQKGDEPASYTRREVVEVETNTTPSPQLHTPYPNRLDVQI